MCNPELNMPSMCDCTEKDRRIAELEARVSSLDCRHAGRYYETSGSHCPIDKPCMRCKDERRIAELESLLDGGTGMGLLDDIE
jgi:hypothetical protein